MRKTYYYAKGEHVGVVMNLSLRMCFWTPPHVITHLLADDRLLRANICQVFNVRELDLFNDNLATIFLPLNHNVIRFYICTPLNTYAGAVEKAGLTSMNDILIMKHRRPSERVFEDSFRLLECQILLGQSQKMAVQILVDEH